MDKFGIILLTLFLFLLIFGPLYRPICLTYSRVKDHRKFNPRTSQFKDARRKLSTVSECMTAGHDKLDIESKLNQQDTGPECPICIGPLFVPSNAHATSGGPSMQTSTQEPDAGGEANALSEANGGRQMRSAVKSGVESARTKLAAYKQRIPQNWGTDNTENEAADNAILTLKNCRHAFHAKCLASWFLIERYDCPVCRSQYWQTKEVRTRQASAPLEPSGGSDSYITRPPAARLAVERLSVPIV